jgi:hypothetical protein
MLHACIEGIIVLLAIVLKKDGPYHCTSFPLSLFAFTETGCGLFKTRGLKRGRLFKPRSLGAQFSLAEKKKVLQAVKKYVAGCIDL